MLVKWAHKPHSGLISRQAQEELRLRSEGAGPGDPRGSSVDKHIHPFLLFLLLVLIVPAQADSGHLKATSSAWELWNGGGKIYFAKDAFEGCFYPELGLQEPR